MNAIVNLNRVEKSDDKIKTTVFHRQNINHIITCQSKSLSSTAVENEICTYELRLTIKCALV